MSVGLKVCYAASEMVPFAKRGGLGDVSAALPTALHRGGLDVRAFLPLYGSIDTQKYGLLPVDFAQDVAIDLAGTQRRFSLWTGPLPGTDLNVYFIDCPALFHRGELYTQDADEPVRFTLFSRAVLESCQRMSFAPDVVHANDWHTGLIPLMLRTLYSWDDLFRQTRSLMAIHNIGYQGAFDAGWIEPLGLGPWREWFDDADLAAGRVNFLRTGVQQADAVATVSPTYAREIQTPELGMGLEKTLAQRGDHVHGILNGVDYDIWSPEKDEYLPHHYSRARLEGKQRCKRHLLEAAGMEPELDAPLFGMITRLAHQKGIDLCEKVYPRFLAETGARLVVLGSGERRFESFFEQLQRRFPRRVAFSRAYDEELSHRIEAGADALVMPSRYEPCGLNQMFSLRYGTIPIVRKTGGLADTVTPFDRETGLGNGILFEGLDPAGLAWALRRALELWLDPPAWKRMMANGMACDFSWKAQAGHYVGLYHALAGDG